MINLILKTYALLTVILLGLSFQAAAQSQEYRTANTLLQQQEYQAALPIFRELYDQNPRSFIYFDKLSECLIHLKRFDEAAAIAREQVGMDLYSFQAAIKLAEIQHRMSR